MRKFYFLLIATLFSFVTFSQSSANYTFTTGSNGSLATDINANALDMSSGTTTLVAVGLDDTRSSLTTIGFEFWFMGSVYTNFSCTENGIVQLGGNTVGASTYLISANTTLALLAPFANDMRVGSDGVVQSKTFGTAPNRVTVIEYKNNMIRYAVSAAAGTGTWQVRLYESTGVVEYVYGSMGTNSSAQTAVNVGFGTNTTAGTFVSVDASHVANTSGTFATFTPTANSTVAHLHSTADGSRRWYRFSPTAPASPSGLTFTSVSATGMTVNWTDNSANELGFVLYRSSDGINFSYAAQTAANATSYTQAGLLPTTTYSWRVHSLSEGALSSPATGSQLTPACSGLAGGTYSVGPTGSYASLTAVAAALANGTTGAAIFELEPTYTTAGETFPISFAGGGCVLTGGVTIRPSASVSSPIVISSANTTATMEFNGIRNVTIDGRPGGTGTTSQLTIANTALGSASAVRFINDASNNTLTYLTLNGSASTSLGIVSFVGGVVTGNDNNIISNNSIGGVGANLPIIGIYSLGTSATVDNSGNTVTGNNIFDYFNATSATSGININSFNSGWTISNNKLYQTATRTYTASGTHTGINITSGSGYTISGNVIGYANASGTGTTNMVGNSVALTGFPGSYVTSGTSNATRYIAISAAFAAGGTVSNIQGNTIAGFALFTSSGANTTNGMLCGISVTSGNVNIGTTSGNTIGATTGTGSIYTATTTSGGAVVGIYATSADALNIRNNTVGAIDAMGTTSSLAGSITGINIAGASSSYDVSGNTIGNATNPNLRMGNLTTGTSLSNVGTTFGSASGLALFRGIFSEIATVTSSGTIGTDALPNIIRNAASTSTSSSNNGGIRGITATGTPVIRNNTITNLSTSSANASVTNTLLAGMGIFMNSASVNGAVVTKNTISNLALTNAGALGTNLAGIALYGGTTEVSGNNISRLSNASTSTTATTPGTVSGIFLRQPGGVQTISNNMISLGNGQTTNTSFIGIWQQNSAVSYTLNAYHNTINIEGAAASGAQPSFGLYRGSFTTTQVTTTSDIRNNIFTNTRSGGTGPHFAIANNYAATVTATGWGAGASDFNVLNANASTVGWWGSNQTIAAWRTSSSCDASSLSGVTVTYVNSATGDLHLNMGTTPTQLESGAAVISGIAIDYDNQVRPGPAGSVNGGAVAPDFGADEFDGVILDLTPPSITYTALPFTCSGTARTLTATIADPTSGVPTTGAGLPTLYWRINTGAWQAAIGTFVSGNTYSFTFGAGAVLSDVVSYYIVAQDNAATPNVGVFPSAGASGFSVNPPAASTPPTTPSSYTINATLNGIYTVGATGTYPTLTAAVADYNTKCLTGPVTFSLIDASYSAAETFPIVVQPNPSASSTNTLTIKPAAGVSPVISGLAASTSVLVLNGADFVTIDGSNTAGGTTRDLTIRNINATTAGVVTVWVASQGAGAGATNDVIKNTVLEGPATGTFTLFNFAINLGANTGAPNGPDNDNITIQNNLIRKAYYGIQAIGGTATANVINDLLITGNTIGGAGTDAIGITGLFMGQADNATISSNDIFGITSTSNIDAVVLTTGVTNSTFTSNRVRDITNNGTNRAAGVNVNAGTGANLTFANNMMYNIISNGTSGLAFGSYGFYVSAGTGYKFYFNTISLTGDRDAVAITKPTSPSAALMVNFSTAASLDVRNNIFVNRHTAATNGPRSYSIYSTAPNTAFSAIDNNDYFVSGAQGTLGFLGSDAATLTALRTAFGSNLNSISVDPSFVSTTDLHMNANTGDNLCLEGKATPIAGVTTDYDGQTRNATTPDIGADEFVFNAPSFVVNAPAAVCVGGSVNLTAAAVTTATAGSTTVGYTYFTDAACTNALSTPAAVTTSGTYYIKATFTSASGGCTYDQILPVTVTINALPTVSIAVTETSGSTANDGSICAGASATLTASGATSYVWSTTATTAAITVSPATTTSYTVTGTDANGCQNTATTTITVNALPTASIAIAETSGTTNNDGTICAGASVSLTATGGTSYLWSDGSTTAAITVSPTTTTTYTVTVTDGNGCSATSNTTITVNALPTTYNVTGGGAYCSGGLGSAVGLSNSKLGVNYQLVFNGTNVGSPVSGTESAISFGLQTAAGTYTVVATNATTTCTETMTGSVTVTISPLPTINTSLTQPTTCATNDGGAALTLGGAAGPYTFNWTGLGSVQGQQNQTTLYTGTYSVIVTAANGCQASSSFTLIGPGGCFVCPTVAAVSTTPAAICQGGTATLSATGLADMGISYGIGFVVSATPLANPYTGTIVATVANGSLTNGGTIAARTYAFSTPGTQYVYAILSPSPADPACRPFQATQINVYATPDVNAVVSQTVCSGSSTAAVNFSSSVPGYTYSWTNNTTSIGLAASGTGNIPSFTATNFTTVPVTATITVTPNNPIPLNFTQTVNYTGASQTWTVPAGVTSIAIEAYGAAGAAGSAGANAATGGVGGKGSKTTGTLAVTPGQVLTINVGGAASGATGGYNGGAPGGNASAGGGGGATDIRVGGTTPADRVLVAGGGGGGGRGGCESGTVTGGAGGDGGNGVNGANAPTPGGFAGGGFGAIGQAGGLAGIGCGGFLGQPGQAGNINGTGGTGGNGQTCCCFSAPSVPGGGGGGGGYIGGGGGGGGSAGTVGCSGNDKGGGGGGAGGSSYTAGVSAGAVTNGINTGDGYVLITYSTGVAANCPGPSKTFTITVNPIPTVNTVADVAGCNGSTVTVPFTGFVPGTVYEWTNSNTAIGLAASGTGNISFTGTNSGTSPITGTIVVTPKFGNSVNGNILSNGGFESGSLGAWILAGANSGAGCDQGFQLYTGNVNACGFGTATCGPTFNYTQPQGTYGISGAFDGAGPLGREFRQAITLPASLSSASLSFMNQFDVDLQTFCSGCTGARIFEVNLLNAAGTSVLTNLYNVTLNPGQKHCQPWTMQNTNVLSALAPYLGQNAMISFKLTIPEAFTGPGWIAFDSIALNLTGGVACTGTPISFPITINPTPTVNAVASETLCSGSATTAVAFSGAVTGTVYNWTNNTPSIGLAATGTGNIASFTAINTGTAPVVATITVTPKYTNGGATCTGTPTTYTITVLPTGQVNTVANQTICNNANTAAVTFGTANTGGTTTYSWTNNTPSIGLAASGTGNIASFVGVNTGTTPVTATITVTPTFTASLGSITNLVSNGGFESGALGAWALAGTNSGGSCDQGFVVYSGNVNNCNFSAATCNGAPLNYTQPQGNYGVSAAFDGAGPLGREIRQQITLPASLASASLKFMNQYDVDLQTYCAGCTGTRIMEVNLLDATGSTLLTNLYNVTLSPGAKYCVPWNTQNLNVLSAITPYLGQNVTLSFKLTIPESFTGPGWIALDSVALNVVSTSCPGTPRTFTITVNPTPTVNSVSNQVICNGSNTTAVAFSGAVTGTVYSWTNNTTSIGLAASGTGNIASFAAVNTGTTPVTATITVTPSYTNGGVTCTGTPTTFTITVNPTPTVNTVANQAVCNGSNTTAVTFSGAVTGTVYSWTNNTPSIGLVASGTGAIASFTAVNTGTTPVVATITVTPSANGCSGTPRTFTITVNPTPTVNAVSNQVVCNRSTTTAVAFSGAVTGTVYNWTNNTTSIGLAASGTGDIAAFTAVNTTQTPVVATITVTPSYTNGGVTCLGTPRTFTITVNPTPIVSATDLFNQRICISDGPVALNATPVGGTWSGIGVSGFNFIPSATAVGNFILTYTYTNQYGCTTTDTTTAKVSACDERNISLASGGAVLFPNPNGGQFNIRVNSTRFQYLQMRIYNQLGQLISTKQWNGLVYGQILPVNMNHLPAAVYTVRIIYDGGNLYEDRGYKMIIQH